MHTKFDSVPTRGKNTFSKSTCHCQCTFKLSLYHENVKMCDGITFGLGGVQDDKYYAGQIIGPFKYYRGNMISDGGYTCDVMLFEVNLYSFP